MVFCHGGNLFGKDTGGINNQCGIKGAAIGGYAVYFSFLYFHAQYGCIQRDTRTILHSIFGIGNGEPIGADAAGGRIGNGERKVKVWLPAAQFLAGNQFGIRNAIAVFADAAIGRNQRL